MASGRGGSGRYSSLSLPRLRGFRHVIERIPPAVYLSSSYYERWLDGLMASLVEKGLLTRAELISRGADPIALTQPAAHLKGFSKRPHAKGRAFAEAIGWSRATSTRLVIPFPRAMCVGSMAWFTAARTLSNQRLRVRFAEVRCFITVHPVFGSVHRCAVHRRWSVRRRNFCILRRPLSVRISCWNR